MGNCFPLPEEDAGKDSAHHFQNREVPETDVAAGARIGSGRELVESKAGEIDPRLTSLLEFFGELYVTKKDLFRRLISVHHDELVGLLKNMEEARRKQRRKSMMRRTQSADLDAVAREFKLDGSADLRLQRFKVKTLDAYDDDDGATQRPPVVVKGGGGATAGKGSGTK